MSHPSTPSATPQRPDPRALAEAWKALARQALMGESSPHDTPRASTRKQANLADTPKRD